MSLVGIDGGRAQFRVGALTVRIVLDGEVVQPTTVGLVEDDRWLSLNARADVLMPDRNALQTHTRAHDAEPLALGTVSPHGPVWRCVVIDVDADPICAPPAITDAVATAIAQARADRCTSITIPLLGTRHGRVSPADSARAIGRALLAAPVDGASLMVIVLCPPAHIVDVRDAFSA